MFSFGASVAVSRVPFNGPIQGLIMEAILAGVQSRLKLQQMYGEFFNFQTL